jgi:hypothetical protein
MKIVVLGTKSLCHKFTIGKNNEPWAIQLYDWVNERQKKLLERFQAFDTEDSNKIMKESFSDVIQGMDAPVEEEDL